MAKQRLGTIGIYKTINPKGTIYVGQSIKEQDIKVKRKYIIQL